LKEEMRYYPSRRILPKRGGAPVSARLAAVASVQADSVLMVKMV
jgi:hypothetical protein